MTVPTRIIVCASMYAALYSLSCLHVEPGQVTSGALFPRIQPAVVLDSHLTQSDFSETCCGSDEAFSANSLQTVPCIDCRPVIERRYYRTWVDSTWCNTLYQMPYRAKLHGCVKWKCAQGHYYKRRFIKNGRCSTVSQETQNCPPPTCMTSELGM